VTPSAGPNPSVVRKAFDTFATETSDDYEFRRWFSERGQWENYRMMYETLRYHKGDGRFSQYLEVGPGPGTWTRLFLRSDARFTLVDISREMLSQARRNLGGRANTRYVEGDFLTVKLRDQFDFFFSSRAIEYLADKATFVRRVHELLSPGSRGIVVTKNPELLTRRVQTLRGLPAVHSGRIASRDLVALFTLGGFTNVRAYPCVVNFPPGQKSFWLSRKIWERIYRQEMRSWQSPLVESYIVTFRK